MPTIPGSYRTVAGVSVVGPGSDMVVIVLPEENERMYVLLSVRIDLRISKEEAQFLVQDGVLDVVENRSFAGKVYSRMTVPPERAVEIAQMFAPYVLSHCHNEGY